MSHLNTIDVIRAWKDPQYRKTVSERDLAALPAHPAGTIELPEELTATVTGGGGFIFYNRAISEAMLGHG